MDSLRPNGASSPLPVRTLAQADRASPPRLRQHALLGFRYIKAIAAFILFLGTDALLVTTAPHVGSPSRGHVQWIWGMHHTALAVVLLLGCMAAVLWWGADSRSCEERRFQESESSFLACVVLALLGLHVLVSVAATSMKGPSLQTAPFLATRGLISELALPRVPHPAPHLDAGSCPQRDDSSRTCSCAVCTAQGWDGEGGPFPEGATCMEPSSPDATEAEGDSPQLSLDTQAGRSDASTGAPTDGGDVVVPGGSDGFVPGGGVASFLVLAMSWYVVVLAASHAMWLLQPQHSALLCVLVLFCFASHSLVVVEPASVAVTGASGQACAPHGKSWGGSPRAPPPMPTMFLSQQREGVARNQDARSVPPSSHALSFDPWGAAALPSLRPLVLAWPRWTPWERLLWVHLLMALVACAGAASFLSCERRKAVLAAARGSHLAAPPSAPNSARHGVRVSRYQPRAAGGGDSVSEGGSHGPLESHSHAAPSWFYRRLTSAPDEAHGDAHAAPAHSGMHVTFENRGGTWEQYPPAHTHVGSLQGDGSFLHPEESLRRVRGMIENFLADSTVPTGQNLHVMRMLVDTALAATTPGRPVTPGGSDRGGSAISQLLGDELQFPVRYSIAPAPAPESLLSEPTDMLVASCPELEELFKEQLGEWDMDVRKLEQLSGGRPMAILAHRALTKDGRTARLKIDEGKLIRFLNAVESGMPPNPYHCATHIADVVASCTFLLDRGGLGIHLNDTEHVAMLLAAAIHDFRHPGVGNDYLVKSEHPIARRYSDRSVLENFHLASAFELMRLPGMNFMEGVSRADRTEIRRLVVDMVLATDIRRHFELVDVVKQQLENGSVFSSSKNSDHSLLMQMALKCADIGHVAKSRERHLAWVDAIQEEFFQQGDMEAAEGLEVAPFMDRTSPNLARSQVGFFNFIVLPLFKVYSATFPASSRLLDMAVDNYGYWQKKATGKLAT
eukprot:jgi/Mesvir1/25429/Mv01709-RA.1